MVQAKTSDFQPLPLKILNVLSLLAGASLLVAVSWEILLGDPRHYSTDYLLLQGIVCVVFLADFFARMWMADHSWRFFFRNLYFFLLSVPYLNIVDWMGIELSHAEAMLMGLVPLLRALLGLYVLFTWIINNRVTRLLTSYVLSMLVFTYFAALIFYDYRQAGIFHRTPAVQRGDRSSERRQVVQGDSPQQQPRQQVCAEHCAERQ